MLVADKQTITLGLYSQPNPIGLHNAPHKIRLEILIKRLARTGLHCEELASVNNSVPNHGNKNLTIPSQLSKAVT